MKLKIILKESESLGKEREGLQADPETPEVAQIASRWSVFGDTTTVEVDYEEIVNLVDACVSHRGYPTLRIDSELLLVELETEEDF